MDKVRIFYDHEGESLVVWFDDPEKETIAEEAGDEVILMKDRTGRVIGFEKLNFRASDPDRIEVAVERVGA